MPQPLRGFAMTNQDAKQRIQVREGQAPPLHTRIGYNKKMDSSERFGDRPYYKIEDTNTITNNIKRFIGVREPALEMRGVATSALRTILAMTE